MFFYLIKWGGFMPTGTNKAGSGKPGESDGATLAFADEEDIYDVPSTPASAAATSAVSSNQVPPPLPKPNATKAATNPNAQPKQAAPLTADSLRDMLANANTPKPKYEYPEEDEVHKGNEIFWRRQLMKASKGGVDRRILEKIQGPKTFLVAVQEHTDTLKDRQKAGVIGSVFDKMSELVDQKPLLVLGYALGMMLRYLLDAKFTKEGLEQSVKYVNESLSKQNKSQQDKITITPADDREVDTEVTSENASAVREQSAPHNFYENNDPVEATNYERVSDIRLNNDAGGNPNGLDNYAALQHANPTYSNTGMPAGSNTDYSTINVGALDGSHPRRNPVLVGNLQNGQGQLTDTDRSGPQSKTLTPNHYK